MNNILLSIFVNLLNLLQRNHLLLVPLCHEVTQFVSVRLLLHFAETVFVALMLLSAVVGKDHYFFEIISDLVRHRKTWKSVLFNMLKCLEMVVLFFHKIIYQLLCFKKADLRVTCSRYLRSKTIETWLVIALFNFWWLVCFHRHFALSLVFKTQASFIRKQKFYVQAVMQFFVVVE